MTSLNALFKHQMVEYILPLQFSTMYWRIINLRKNRKICCINKLNQCSVSEILVLMLQTHSTLQDLAMKSCLVFKANMDVLWWFHLLPSYTAVCMSTWVTEHYLNLIYVRLISSHYWPLVFFSFISPMLNLNWLYLCYTSCVPAQTKRQIIKLSYRSVKMEINSLTRSPVFFFLNI